MIYRRELLTYQQVYKQLLKSYILKNIHFGKYEVFPTEPLHDLKGHIRNIIEEATKKALGETLGILKQIQATVLNKSTLWCSDYRKALILIYNALQQCNSPNLEILELFRTATEISEIMYARDSKRTPKEVLRFHNLTYQHGKLCMDVCTAPTLHQAHLQRISDFLLPGPGVWWQHTPGGL